MLLHLYIYFQINLFEIPKIGRNCATRKPVTDDDDDEAEEENEDCSKATIATDHFILLQSKTKDFVDECLCSCLLFLNIKNRNKRIYVFFIFF